MPEMNEVKATYREPGTTASVEMNRDLVRSAQRGSVAAVRQLYLNHHRRIYRFIWSRVYDPNLAEDLTGEVFMRMLKNLSTYEERSFPFHAWLFRIARNLIADHFRKQASRTDVPLDEIAGKQAENKSLEDMAEQTLKLELVQQSLEQINPQEREVVELRFIAGLSLKETAQAIDKTVSAVKALQHRGLVSLRANIRNDEDSR
jgi:RNA polymerase sigma-70 factor (ECF subfamily)